MKLRETMNLPLSAREAAAMYADSDYAEIRRRTLGADAASAVVSGDPAGEFTVTTDLHLPTDRVPDIAKRFVGSSLTVRETQRWSAPAADGSRTGTMEFDVVGLPAGMQGTARLAPAGEGSCTVEIDGDLTAKVPLIGARLEKAAQPYVSKVLRAEERSATTYREQSAAS